MAIIAGVLIALAAVYLVLEPLLQAARGHTVSEPVPLFSDSDDEADPLMARRDRALAALKEIDFDRATGKLSDEDYDALKSRFTREALDAMKSVEAAESAAAPSVIATPLPAPASGGSRFCMDCGTALDAKAKFCLECGAPTAVLQP